LESCLAPYDPQQQPSSGKETNLERLTRSGKAKFDLAFPTIMTARHRAGSKLAATELRDGSLPRFASSPSSCWPSTRPSSPR
jgi:hypothetical protein